MYFDDNDLLNVFESLTKIHKAEEVEETEIVRQHSVEPTIVAEDINNIQGDGPNVMDRLCTKYYSRYIVNGAKVVPQIYNLLKSLVQGDPSTQINLYKYLHCFQKHLNFFDEAIDLSVLMIKDNQVILNQLAATFFQSLHLVKDFLFGQDKKRFYIVDIECKDKNSYLYQPQKQGTGADQQLQIEEKEEGKLLFERPTNLLVYVLILLSKKTRKPKFLSILETACVLNGQNFVPNQENLIDLFCENEQMTLLFMAQTEMHQVKAVQRLVTKFDEDKGWTVVRACFEDGSLVKYQDRVNFMIAQINLYSALCQGRNLKWKVYLMKYFGKKDLINEMIDPAYSSSTSYIDLKGF